MVSEILAAIAHKMSASSSEKLVPFYQTTPRHVPEDSNPKLYHAAPEKRYGVDEVFTERVRDGSVGIATRYWLDGPGIESR